jgi:hypothetical protein
MTSPPGGGSRKKRPVLVPVIAVLLATGMGTTAVLGGLDQVPTKRVTQLGPGSFLDQGHYRTQFVGAKSYVIPPETQFGEPQRVLDVDLKVTNLSTKTDSVGTPPAPGGRSSTYGAFANSILRTTPPIKTKYGAEAFVLSRGVQSHQLHPRVTNNVVVRYELDDGAEVPQQLVLDMGAHYLFAGINDPIPRWELTSEPVKDVNVPITVAKVTLPVRDEEGF